MPRPARKYLLPEAPSTIHYLWRFHNTSFLFNNIKTKQKYIDLMSKHKDEYGVEIYAFTIMNNHFHALLKIPSRSAWEKFSRRVNSQLAVFINKQHGRRGNVIMDRPKTILLQSDQDILNVLNYIELNPLRAGLKRHAKSYAWTSDVTSKNDRHRWLLSPCPSFLALAKSKKQRRALFIRRYRRKAEQATKIKSRPEYCAVNFIGTEKWVKQQKARLRFLQKQKLCRAGP